MLLLKNRQLSHSHQTLNTQSTNSHKRWKYKHHSIIFLQQHSTSCFIPCRSDRLRRHSAVCFRLAVSLSFQQAGNLWNVWFKKIRHLTLSSLSPVQWPETLFSDPSVFFLPSHPVMSVTVLCPPLTLNLSACLTATNQTSEGWKKVLALISFTLAYLDIFH